LNYTGSRELSLNFTENLGNCKPSTNSPIHATIFSLRLGSSLTIQLEEDVARPLTKQEIHRVWASYLNPLKPSVPQIGDPQEADCIWTQAYSRVHYSEAQLPSIIGAFRKEANNDDERTIELIIKDGFDPGSANFKLAQLGTEMSER
jgi:hypothetical protein